MDGWRGRSVRMRAPFRSNTLDHECLHTTNSKKDRNLTSRVYEAAVVVGDGLHHALFARQLRVSMAASACRLPARPSFPNDLRVVLLDAIAEQPETVAKLQALNYTGATSSTYRSLSVDLGSKHVLPCTCTRLIASPKPCPTTYKLL